MALYAVGNHSGGSRLRSLTINSAVAGAIVAVAMTAGTAVSNGAFAQTDSRTTTVTERSRPELDALGVKAGGFTIFPSIEIGGTYDDNIFGTQNNTRDDIIGTFTPAVRIDSDWNRHFLRIFGDGEIKRHSSNSTEDVEKAKFGANGRLDIRRDTNATAGFTYEQDTEERGSANEANGITPTDFDVISLDAGISNKWNRVSLTADGAFRKRDFDDVRTTTGVTNNDDRDRDEFKLDVRGGYEIQPEYEAFLQLILNSVDYDIAVDDNGLDRDSEGYEIRAGARIDFSALIFGDVFVGYIDRDFDSAALKSVETFTGGIDLTWNATTLTTVKGGISRNISETTLATASGNLQTTGRVSVDHELLRNLILSARASVSLDEFEGSSREDEYFRAGIGAKYFLNRYLSLILDVNHETRDSNAVNSDQETNKVILKIRGQL